MMIDSSSEPSYLNKSLQFLSDYFFHSEHKWKAWLLIAGGVLSVLVVTGLGFTLGWWCFPYIFASFIAKDLTLLLMGIGAALLIAGGMAGFNYLANYLKNILYVDWRAWVSNKVIGHYLNNKTNYLEISRLYKDLDNPEQRIQEDIDQIIESSLDLSFGFIENFSNLTIFIVLLWIAGSTLSVALLGAGIVIPGYLVLVALIVGGVTSLIGYFVNKSLQKLSNEEIKAQSDFRSDLQQLKNAPEEIAIEHGEDYYNARLSNDVSELNKKTTKRLSVQNGTTAFNLFNGIFQAVVPFLAAVPLYFVDLITLDVFYSVGYYFSMVTRSLNWFIDSFETINTFNTSLSRVIALQTILDKNNATESTQKIIRRIEPHNKNLEIRGLDLKLPTNNELIVKGLNLTFTPGVHTLIQSPSGTGKSSLFKAIAGTWICGEGEIIIPKSFESIYFLPQKPMIPDDTIRKVLAYPDANCSYSDETLITALKAVGMESLTSKLDEHVGFKSLGEQQRMAFARVLLRKPDWVFLDEATASLDEEIEEHVYKRIKELLPKTTIISIAHRSTVRHHHDNILFFRVNKDKEVEIEEKRMVVTV
jgi:putative ATP-binding cassette transporter